MPADGLISQCAHTTCNARQHVRKILDLGSILSMRSHAPSPTEFPRAAAILCPKSNIGRHTGPRHERPGCAAQIVKRPVRHGLALLALARFSDGFVERMLGLAEAAVKGSSPAVVEKMKPTFCGLPINLATRPTFPTMSLRRSS